MYKVVTLITLGIFLVAGGIFYFFNGNSPDFNPTGSKRIEVFQQWDLPAVLEEVSGIAMMDDNRIAAVQDEEGKIFIYNLQTSQIEKQLYFSGTGDFEGIAIVNETAYVLESDGILFEVQNFMEDKEKSIKYSAKNTDRHNFEGLAYDQKNNRLLLAIKDMDNDNFKPVFSFDLKTKQFVKDPVVKVNLKDTIFDKLKQKKSHRLLRPSEIAIHPVTGDYYILEGVNPKLLILDPQGNLKKLHILNPDQFRQAEGITISKNGDIFISNEGKGGMGNILKVSLD